MKNYSTGEPLFIDYKLETTLTHERFGKKPIKSFRFKSNLKISLNEINDTSVTFEKDDIFECTNLNETYKKEIIDISQKIFSRLLKVN